MAAPQPKLATMPRVRPLVVDPAPDKLRVLKRLPTALQRRAAQTPYAAAWWHVRLWHGAPWELARYLGETGIRHPRELTPEQLAAVGRFGRIGEASAHRLRLWAGPAHPLAADAAARRAVRVQLARWLRLVASVPPDIGLPMAVVAVWRDEVARVADRLAGRHGSATHERSSDPDA